jgi:citrate lyase subunit beta/citryl-CoA lyase
MLFTPADNPSRMHDAAETEADACIFDLEDAIPKDRQEEARDNLHDLVDEIDFEDKQVYTRIENPGTEYWLGDLRAAIDAGVDGVSIPKVESTHDVHVVTEAARQMATDPPDFRVGIESPEGVFSGAEIARFCRDRPSVTAISFGSADYCRAIGAPEINDRVKEFMSHVFIGYAALGDLDAYASGTLEIDNLERLRTLLEQQRELGYVGASCIHPKQLATINDVFTPDEEEYEQAKKLVAGYDDYDGDSVVIDDVFLDTATADRYRELVRRYERVHGAD